MTGRSFADNNVVVYAEASAGEQSKRARLIMEATPVVSTQVLNESLAVLIRKNGFSRDEAHEVVDSLIDLCEVVPVDAPTVREAMRLASRYDLQHWDALIVASALAADCETLYSEDMQHGQVFDGRITVTNPFL